MFYSATYLFSPDVTVATRFSSSVVQTLHHTTDTADPTREGRWTKMRNRHSHCKIPQESHITDVLLQQICLECWSFVPITQRHYRISQPSGSPNAQSASSHDSLVRFAIWPFPFHIHIVNQQDGPSFIDFTIYIVWTSQSQLVRRRTSSKQFLH